jgi:hypothetical protein
MSKNIYLPPGPPPSLELAAQAEGLAAKRCAITRILCEFGRQAWLDALDNNLPCFLVRYANQIDDYLEAYDAGAEAPRLQHLLEGRRPFYDALPELGPLLANDVKDVEQDARPILSRRFGTDA